MYVFPRKEAFPTEWLYYLEYLHSKDFLYFAAPVETENGLFTTDPVMHMWYSGICLKHYPEGFAQYGPVPIIIEKDDVDIFLCLVKVLQ